MAWLNKNHPAWCLCSTPGGVQYTGACSVHWGTSWVQWGDTMSTPGDVQYTGGISWVQWGIPWVHQEVFSTPRGYCECTGGCGVHNEYSGVFSTPGISWVYWGCSVHWRIFSTLEDIMKYTRRCSVHWRDTMNTLGENHEYTRGFLAQMSKSHYHISKLPATGSSSASSSSSRQLWCLKMISSTRPRSFTGSNSLWWTPL